MPESILAVYLRLHPAWFRASFASRDQRTSLWSKHHQQQWQPESPFLISKYTIALHYDCSEYNGEEEERGKKKVEFVSSLRKIFILVVLRTRQEENIWKTTEIARCWRWQKRSDRTKIQIKSTGLAICLLFIKWLFLFLFFSLEH